MPAQLGILIGPKGRGANMRAIAEACVRGEVLARVAAIVSPVDGTPAVEWARASGLKVEVVAPGEDYGRRLVFAVAGCDWLCLAGYLRLLPDEVLEAFPDKILNIHPALLPKYGGKGMYGLRVHEAVLAAGEVETGCTVHLVTKNYDEGPPILQTRCPVLTGDTPETLAARVLELEQRTYSRALRAVLESSESRFA